MNKHAYLCAYMAGIAVPTLLLLVGMTIFTVARFVYDVPVPIERIIVFPMAVVPNLWGLWNIVYVSLHGRRRLSIGFHGAILPFVLAPLGFTVARAVGFDVPSFIANAFPIVFPIVIVVYYLVWKLAVHFLNETLGIA